MAALPIWLLLLPALLLALPAARAEEQPSAADLPAVEQALQQSRQRQLDIETQRREALELSETLSERLVLLADGVRSAERKLAAASEAVRALKIEKAKLTLDLAGRQDELSAILAGLQQLEQNPPPPLVVKPHDVLGALRSAMLFGSLVPELREKATALRGELESLAATEARLKEQTRAEEQAMAALQQSRASMKTLVEEKRKLAQTLTVDLAEERKKAEALAAEAKTLKDLVDKLAAEEARNKEQAEAARKAEEERRAALKLKPRQAFAASHGLLAFPADGTLAKRFGDDTGLGHALDGIVIATAPTAQVTSPASGRIEFAGPFRSYGNMVIVNPGDGYLVLLAGLDEVAVSPGQSVVAGEPVARMGAKPVALALSKDLPLATTPMLYVEFRKNGQPVDPTPWWSVGAPTNVNQEAMR